MNGGRALSAALGVLALAERQGRDIYGGRGGNAGSNRAVMGGMPDDMRGSESVDGGGEREEEDETLCERHGW